MFDDEIEFAESVSVEPVTVLEEQMRVLRVKEFRIARRMKAAMEAEREAGKDDGNGKKKPDVVALTVSTTQTRNFAGEESKTISKTAETFAQNYLRLEQAHTSVLAQISKTADLLAQLKKDAGIGDEPLPLYTLPPEEEHPDE